MPTSSETFGYLAAGLYWIIILCWLAILSFYWREHRRLRSLRTIVGTMLVVVFLDGARTLLENVYFGTIYTARAGLLPRFMFELLSEPQLVIVPKMFNLVAALVIIVVLVRQWFPAMREELDRQRRIEQLYEELKDTHAKVQAAHDGLSLAHQELTATHTELRSAREAQEALTHMIVHDMRTPLTSVITGLQTVQQTDYDPDLTPEMVDGALTGANRLLTMVNDLLDIGKMEAGMMTVNPEVFSMGEAVLGAVDLVGALAREKDIAIVIEGSGPADRLGGPGADMAASRDVVPLKPAPGSQRDGRDNLVQADREIVRRILVNLLGNALKFTPRLGTITVAIERSGRDSLRVAVHDEGPGIAEADQQRIFQKFYQVGGGNGNGSANGVPSTGLGLAYCKMATEVLGGEIGVTSDLGSGSSFWFTLPTGQV